MDKEIKIEFTITRERLNEPDLFTAGEMIMLYEGDGTLSEAIGGMSKLMVDEKGAYMDVYAAKKLLRAIKTTKMRDEIVPEFRKKFMDALVNPTKPGESPGH